MNYTNEVVFIYLGDSFPRYAKSSLHLAQKHSGLNVHIIGNKILEKSASMDGVRFSSVEEFYNPDIFREIAKKSMLPNEFRNGFWLKTLERFFVMSQFMENHNVSKVFHAEIDQLLFGCNELVDSIERSSQNGFFLPFHSVNRVVASVVYCNDLESLKSLIDYTQEVELFENEMILLANWALENPNRVVALPTLSFELNGTSALSAAGIPYLTSQQIGGVVDAAQLGQWVGGEDPRNLLLSEKPKNKFVFDNEDSETLSHEQLAKIRLSIASSDQLTCIFPEKNVLNVFNLHLHSKIHLWLMRSDKNLYKLIDYSNLEYEVSLPSTRKLQLRYLIKIAILSLKKDPKRVLKNYLPSGRRFKFW